VHYPNKKSAKTLEAKVDKLIENDKDQCLSIQRLTIFEENLPISERIIAADKYLKKGGNGDTKRYFEKNAHRAYKMRRAPAVGALFRYSF
jgi:hypothetical protein